MGRSSAARAGYAAREMSAASPAHPESAHPDSARQPKRDVVAAVLERDGRFLLGKRNAHKKAAGYWCPICGGVEPGEPCGHLLLHLNLTGNEQE